VGSAEERDVETARTARAGEQVTSDDDSLSPSAFLRLQQGAGNAVVARLLTIGHDELSADQITRQSAYKRRLNTIISREARAVGLTPDNVRQELVLMTSSGSHEFTAPTAAVREAIRRLIRPLPTDGFTVRELVRRSLTGLKGAELSQSVILARLEAAFGDRKRLHEASKDPEFVDALLEAIRTRQSKTWKKATKIEQVGPTPWTNEEMQYWSARHYTNKFRVVLGDDLGDGTFAISEVLHPPFNELISSITLATMDRPQPAPSGTYKKGDSMMLTFSSGAATSGHTTGVDWKNIGNVGDTFFGLFYKEEPATGVVPAFIRDAVYYATWSVTEFGSGWASADWLASAKESQTEGAPTPAGTARKGELSDIVADIFPEAATRDFTASRGEETPDSQKTRREKFSAMENFEVKKHGPLAVKAWLPVEANVTQIKKWSVDAKTGALVKLKTKQERSEDTDAAALLKSARALNVVTHQMRGKEDVYTWEKGPFNGESDLEKDPSLFDALKEAVEKELKRREEEPAPMPLTTAPPLPTPGPPPPPPAGGSKPAIRGTKKTPH
jgi:hypothetical protein